MQKIKDWIKKRENAILLAILTVGIILRLKYFLANGSVWWDEGEYLSTALHWAQNIPYTLNPQRPVILPILEAIFLKLGTSEAVMRFFILFLPSVGTIFTTYLLGKELFDKKTGIIAAGVIAFSWELLFNTTRFHVEIPLIFFMTLSMLFFWKGFIKNNNKAKYYAAFFTGIAFLTKFTTILLIISYALFLIIAKRKIFKEKETYYATGIGLITLLPYFIWAKIQFNSALAFKAATTALSDGGNGAGNPIAWNILNNIHFFLETFWFIIFLAGLILALRWLLIADIILKNEEEKEINNLFLIIFLIIFFSYFIFIERAAEDRWVLPTIIALALIIGNATKFLATKLAKKKKALFSLTILLVLIIGGFTQINLAEDTINARKDTYLQVKEAAFFLEEITETNEYILTNSGPQTMYYARRPVQAYGPKDYTITQIQEKNIRFMTVSGFERHPDWVQQFLQENQQNLKPVHAYTIEGQTQPILIIFEITNREKLK